MMEDRSKSENNGHMNGQSVPRVVRQVKRADDRLVAFVEERPLVALGIAIGLGYVLGRVMTRRG